MANTQTIQIKRNSVEKTATPTALAAGELAINLLDRSLFSYDGSSIIKLYTATDKWFNTDGYANNSLKLDGKDLSYFGTASQITALNNSLASTNNVIAGLDSVYLKLTGGTIKGTYGALVIERDNSNSSLIKYVNSAGVLGHLGFDSSGNPIAYLGTDVNSQKALLHAGNYDTYSVRKDTNSVFETALNEAGYGYSSNGWPYNGPAITFGVNQKYKTHLQYQYALDHLCVLSLNNGVATEWRQLAYITDNVASATKLKTSRTLWGQSFDGTASISGTLKISENISLTSTNGLLIKAYSGGWARGITYISSDETTRLGWIGVMGYGDKANDVVITPANYDSADSLRIFSNGNTTIGHTSDRGYKLAVAGQIQAQTIVPVTNLAYDLGSTTYSWNRLYTRYIDTPNGYDLRFCTSGNEWLRIGSSNGFLYTANGFRIIANTKPAEGEEASNVNLFEFSTANALHIGYGLTTNPTYIYGSGVYLRYGSDRTIGVSLLSNGNVLIGNPTDDGVSRLQVNGRVSVKGNIIPHTSLTGDIGSYNYPWNTVYTRYIDTYAGGALSIKTANTERINISTTGMVSITDDLKVARYLYLPNGTGGVYLRDNAETPAHINALYMGTNNRLYVGYGTFGKGYITSLCGAGGIYFHYGETGSVALTISSEGTISVLASSHLSVGGTATISGATNIHNTLKVSGTTSLATLETSRSITAGTKIYTNYVACKDTASNNGQITFLDTHHTYLYSSRTASPTLGALNDAGVFGISTGQSYGMYLWTQSNGQGYIQQGRSDGTETVYALNLNPLGGVVNIASLGVSTYVKGNFVVGTATNAAYTYLYGNTTVGSSTMELDGNIKLITTKGNIALRIGTSGNRGIYDYTNSVWLIYYNQGNARTYFQDGDVQVNNNLYAVGATTISKTLSVTGDTTLGGLLTVAGNTTLAGTLSVNSSITAASLNLGSATLSYNSNGWLEITGNVVVKGTLAMEELGTGGNVTPASGVVSIVVGETTYNSKNGIVNLPEYATVNAVDNRINALINGAPAAYDTLKEIADVLQGNVNSIGDIVTTLGNKANKATTLEGYGITDALNSTTKYALAESVGGKAIALNVPDIRDTTPLPKEVTTRAITSWFNNQDRPGTNSWYSGINVAGWTSTYTVWQLSSSASVSDSRDNNLYFRTGRNETWGDWQTVLTSANYSKTLGSVYAPLNNPVFASDKGYNALHVKNTAGPNTYIAFIGNVDGAATTLGFLGFKSSAPSYMIPDGSASYNLIHTGNYTTTTDKRYLQLSGGVLTKNSSEILTLKRDASTGAFIKCENTSGTLGRFGMTNLGNFVAFKGDQIDTFDTFLHTGNYSETLDNIYIRTNKAALLDGRIDISENASYRNFGYGYTTNGWYTTGAALAIGASGSYYMMLQGASDSSGNAKLYFCYCYNGTKSEWKTFAYADQSYTKTASDARYLQLSGGTLTNSATGILTVKRESTTNGAYIKYENSANVLGYLGITAAKKLYLYKGDQTSTASAILDSDNYSEYALPKTGGTISGTGVAPLYLNTSADSQCFAIFQNKGNAKTSVGWSSSNGSYIYNYATGLRIGVKDDGTPYFGANTLLHSTNYSSYALPLTGGDISGVINFGVASNASARTRGINFDSYAHIGCAETLLGIYSAAKIVIRPYGGTSSGAGLDITDTSFKFNNKEVVTTGNIGEQSVNEAYINFGGKHLYSTYSPIDAAMIPVLGANRFAFIPADSITVEYSRDGGATWEPYEVADSSKVNLLNGNDSAIYIGGTSQKGIDKSLHLVRITIDTETAPLYTSLRKFAIKVSTNGSTGCYCTLSGRTKTDYLNETDNWNVFADRVSVGGWSGWNILNTSTFTTYGNNYNGYYKQVRFTFGVTSHESTVNYSGLQVMTILGFGGQGWSVPSNMAKNGLIYTYDSAQNVSFPKIVTAPQFTGALVGNADTATKLKTSRSLWGNTFNGSNDISGSIILSSGNIYIPNNSGLYIKDNAETPSNIAAVHFNSDNNMYFGYGTLAKSYATYICGGSGINFRYGPSAIYAMSINDAGITFSSSSKFNGNVNVNNRITIANESTLCVKDNNGDNSTDISTIWMDSSNLLRIGYGTASKSYETRVYGGSALKLMYGTGNIGLILDSAGDISVSKSLTVSGTYLKTNSIVTKGQSEGTVKGSIQLRDTYHSFLCSIVTENPSLGALGAAGVWAIGNGNFGTYIWAHSNGPGYIQQGYNNGNTGVYSININPLGGAVNLSCSGYTTSVKGYLSVTGTSTFTGNATFSGDVVTSKSIAVGTDLTFKNSRYIYFRDTSDTSRNVMVLTTSNVLQIGYGTRTAGYDTYIHGSSVYLRYGTDNLVGLSINTEGRVSIQQNLRVLGSSELSGSVSIGDALSVTNGITAASLTLGSAVLSYNTDGWLNVSTNIVSDGTIGMYEIASTSDRKLKRNIKYLSSEDALNVIRHLKPSSWNWKRDSKAAYGLIAQDVAEVTPEMVTTIGDRLHLQYNQLHAFEIGAIQKIDSDVDTLKKELAEAKVEIERLKQQLKHISDVNRK